MDIVCCILSREKEICLKITREWNFARYKKFLFRETEEEKIN